MEAVMTPVASEPVLEGPVRLVSVEDGAVWRLILSTPKANVLDAQKIAALTVAFQHARDNRGVKAIVIEGEGPHFSFGASVEEHLPEQCEAMLHAFHGLFRTALEAAVPTVAAVRGLCLGGALELASFCHRVIAAPGAQLGQPEIALGVIAPIASILLTDRVGRGAAEDLCLSGRAVEADEALRMGLVDELDENPGEAAMTWVRQHLLSKSASSLRHAVRAVRMELTARVDRDLPALEALYLDELMDTYDAVEGLNAFVEKREPQWRNE
jgi:cyclohexa-1,5-dienecarbonyl-CoA hydratase